MKNHPLPRRKSQSATRAPPRETRDPPREPASDSSDPAIERSSNPSDQAMRHLSDLRSSGLAALLGDVFEGLRPAADPVKLGNDQLDFG